MQKNYSLPQPDPSQSTKSIKGIDISSIYILTHDDKKELFNN